MKKDPRWQYRRGFFIFESARHTETCRPFRVVPFLKEGASMGFTTGNIRTVNWLNIFLPSLAIAGMAIGGAAWWYYDTEVARKIAEEYAERQEVHRIVMARLEK